MAEESVTLIGFWGSPFVLRVKWALELKVIQYQYVEEDLGNKSPMLLQYNPVYKKVPVLVHGNKPLAESLVILEYIDETWKQDPPLLPHDPYERAQARFWSRFVDEKSVPALMATFSKGGEEQQKAAQEVRESLKILEGGLEGKRYFGGERIGFADITIGLLGYWVRIVEETVGINLIDKELMPEFDAWIDDFLEFPVIKECMPHHDKLLYHSKAFHKILTSSST
ncbi:hypothetical protein VNO78_01305 [Psophocarpus tetragonolobus]|uniref:glutathione transferase n=1 Tax=Psophocarpus tetragonolobus TaxID=3891 RepID=A0AAN9T1H1_PSOTE